MCGNYRGIQLISMVRKVLSLVLARQLAPWAEGQEVPLEDGPPLPGASPPLLESQCGFRPQRGCADQLFSLRHLVDLTAAQQLRLYCCFVDLRKAFDSICRLALWAVLRRRGLPERLIAVLQDLHTGTSCSVRVGTSLSHSFATTCGTQQGDPLAGLLFSIYMDHVVREAEAAARQEAASLGEPFGVQLTWRNPESLPSLRQPRGSGNGHTELPQLLLADDLVATSHSAVSLQIFMRHLEAACVRWQLTISSTKTECMVVDPRQQQAPERWRSSIRCQGCSGLKAEGMLVCDCCDAGWHMACLQAPLTAVPEGDWLCPHCEAAAAASGGAACISRSAPVRITIAGQPVAWVAQFKYLGSQFASNSGLDAELAYRCSQAGRAFERLSQPVWQRRSITLPTKLRIYTAMVRSVLLYGAHSWALAPAQLEKLEVLQRSHLRRILGRSSWKVPPGGDSRPKYLSNEALMAACLEQPTVETQLLRLRGRWVGHVLRMSEDRLARQLFFGSLATTAPPQSRPPPSLLAQYTADTAARYPRSELRKLDVPCLLCAAANRADWHAHFA